MKQLIPCSLTVNNINSLFKKALVQEDTTETIRVVLFQKTHGFKEDSRAVYFDKKVIEEIKPRLEYSLGQLLDVHENYNSITTDSVKDIYDETQWTDNSTSIMAYLHLLLAAELVKPLEFSTGELEFVDKIIPTYLLADSKYSDWFKQNQNTYLKKYLSKNNGQKPADD